MSSSSGALQSGDGRLSEANVQDSFHSYLKSSLTQAKVERLLDEDVLSSATGDMMITGPALCLYFAALRCTTVPPSVPLPQSRKSGAPQDLSEANCPPAFISFLRVWAQSVPSIQRLSPEHQHDLARIICGLQPIAQPTEYALNGIAADLRAVAIEISQRRSFQERLSNDLQAALDSGRESRSGVKVKASFVPPPEYVPPPNASADPSPRPNLSQLPTISTNVYAPPQSPTHLSPWPRSPSPTILGRHTPAIEIIRETLYASLGDVLERTPSLRRLLKTDPSRAYYASVAFAILEVSTTAVTEDGSVVGVLGKELTLEECPQPLRPFMSELAAIGRHAKQIDEEDTQKAMEFAQRGADIPLPHLERVKLILEQGVGHDRADKEGEEGRRSVEGRAVAFTNRINALALGMTKLKAFQERQTDVFKVLGGISS